MKKHISLSALLLLALPSLAAEFPLVRKGGVPAPIVIPEAASERTQHAASILQQYIERMTGAKPVIVDDAQPVSGPVVLIGRTKRTPAELAKVLKLDTPLVVVDPLSDGYAVRVRKDALSLLGHGDEGTVYAVYDVLRRLGCRWFFACPVGEVVPQATDLALATGDRVECPAFAHRMHYSWRNRTPEVKAREKAWRDANRLSGGNIPGVCGHNFNAIWPKSLYAEYPEYFPLVKVEKKAPLPTVNDQEAPITGDGDVRGVDQPPLDEKRDEGPEFEWKRVPKGQRCLSNPDVIRLGVEWARKTLREHPEYRVITFAPTDGYSHCECDNCKALGNLADRNIHLAAQVREAIADEFPTVMVHIWAYAATALVPSQPIAGYEAGDDMVLVTLFRNFTPTPWLDLVAGWSRASNCLVGTDVWHYFHWQWGGRHQPVWRHEALAAYPGYRDQNVKMARLQVKGDWAKVGLHRYLSARLMWNPDEDVDALIHDFCAAMFPEATPDFYNYISLYEAYGRKAVDVAAFLTRGCYFLGRIRDRLTSAQSRERWEFYVLYMRALELSLDLAQAKDRDTKLDLHRQSVAYYKGVADRGVLEGMQRVRAVSYHWLKELGETPPDHHISTIEPAKYPPESIDELFERLRKRFAPAGLVMRRQPLDW